MDEESRGLFQAYADGINDYVSGVSLFEDQSTASALPPEFYVFGISKESFQPWTVVDSLCIARMVSFTFSAAWMFDLYREVIRKNHPELKDIAEELMPFTSDHMADSSVTIVSDDDLKQWSLYSDQSIVERYRQAKDLIDRASPPITD